MPSAATTPTIHDKTWKRITATRLSNTNRPRISSTSCASSGMKMTASTGPTLAKYLLNPYDNAGPTCGDPGGAPYSGGGGGGEGGGGGGGTSDTFAPQLGMQDGNAVPPKR